MSNYPNNNGHNGPNNNGYDNPNNNGYGNPNINAYGNPNNNAYGNNPYNQNYNSPQKLPENLRSIKKLSIAYIVLFFLTIALIVAGYVIMISSIVSSPNYDYYYGYTDVDQIINTGTIVGYFLIVVGALLALALFIIAIVLAVKSGKLKNFSNDFNTIFVLFVVGIFVGFLSLIASFMTISKVNMIRR